MIAVKGPQVMVGYLKRPEATAKVLKDGWYITGDIGYVDADGFLKITDRLSRFSKIAGEMVPHVGHRVGDHGGDRCRRTSRRGHVRARSQARRAALRALHRSGHVSRRGPRRSTPGPLPKVWIPSARDFIQVEEIPITATGKVDLRRIRRNRPEPKGRCGDIPRSG